MFWVIECSQYIETQTFNPKIETVDLGFKILSSLNPAKSFFIQNLNLDTNFHMKEKLFKLSED